MPVFLQTPEQTLKTVRYLRNFQPDMEGQGFIADVHKAHPIFNTSLVLQNIAQWLSVTDLVNNFSLVNQLWHREARLCLRDRKGCTLAPGRIKYPEDAEAVLMLCTSDVIPFNRISVNYGGDMGEGRWGNVIFGPIFKLIDAMNLKCLHVNNYKYQFGSDNYISAAAETLTAHILRSKWKVVEEISFGIIEYSRGRFAGDEEHIHVFGRLNNLVKFEDGFCLPALHSLTFNYRQKVERLLFSTLVLPILSIAPVLKNLNLDMSEFLTLFSTRPVFAQEKLGLLTRLTLYLDTHHGFELFKSLINTNVACKQLKVRISANFIRTQEIMQLLPSFLHQSQKSLAALTTNVKTIQSLQTAGLLALTMPNMRYLFLATGEKRYGAEIYDVFSGLRNSFPNLRSITLNEGWDSCVCPKENIIGKKHLDSTSITEGLGWRSVKRLIFHDCFSETSAEFFSIMLPQLRHLGVSGLQEKSEYSRIVQFWPHLESLELFEHRPNRLELEAALCGINEAEVCELRQVVSHQLCQMAIVPIGPTIIAGMPNLKSLRVNVVHDQACIKGLECPVPHVSECVAYSRKKNLRVSYQFVPSSRRLEDEEGMDY